MDNKKPLISIITVSFNSVKTIEKTILSVINQTYKNIEYLIIDGGSTDGTIDIIKKYNDKISYWVSEKDNGIYDAMNKGVIMATGDYLNFMNSDDYFFNDKVLFEVIPYLNNEYNIVYGNVEVIYNNFRIIKKEPLPKYLWMGSVNHQSTFFKNKIIQKYKYNTNNKLVADYELFLNIYYNEGKILKIEKTIASYSNNGISSINDRQVIIDCYKTIKKFKKNIFIKIYYKILLIKPIIKKLIPFHLFLLIKSKFA